jgi:hypothetical protein
VRSLPPGEGRGEALGLRGALSRQRGRLLVAGVLAAYFLILTLLGGHSAWDRLGVPDFAGYSWSGSKGSQDAPLSFADMRVLASGWECDREGVEIFPRDPCDPWGRGMDYPRIWMQLSFLGLGPGATVALGIATALIFFASFLLLIGNPGVREAALYALAAISPAVMFGVERGNIDLLMFAMLVAALLVFRRGPAGRLAGYALLLFAGILKLFPAFAWGVLVRQPRRLALLSGGVIVGLFAAYIASTLYTIRLVHAVLPLDVHGQYGADLAVASVRYGAGLSPGLDNVHWVTIAALTAGAGAIAALTWRRRALGESLAVRADSDLKLDAFIAGAGIYVFSFVLWHNWDYRLTFLLLALPQLIVWTRASRSPVPAPRMTLVALLGTLWLGLPLSLDTGFWNPVLDFITLDDLGVSLDEILNWILFVTLGAGLVLATVPLVVRNWGVSAYLRRLFWTRPTPESEDAKPLPVASTRVERRGRGRADAL